MFSKFHSLDQSKKERIINAALKEFAQKGYEGASTNAIVKEAKIGKGMLFHYFHNKKDLFLFLYDHSLSVLQKDFLEKFDFAERDIFERLRKRSRLKIEVLKKHPDLFDFLMTAYYEESEEIKPEMEKRKEEIPAKKREFLYKDFDTTKFRDDIDIESAINVMIWSFEGISAKERKKNGQSLYSVDHLNEILEEVDYYIQFFKNCFYKE